MCTIRILHRTTAAVIAVLMAMAIMLHAADDGTNDVAESKADAYEQIELLSEVFLHVKKQYVEEKTYEQITTGALNGMLRSLDPYSAFLGREEYSNMRDDTEGHYGGIGVHIGIKKGILTVIAPIEDTPGYRAGLQSGDRILAVNGEKTEGLTIREAVKKLRGPKGESVTILIGQVSDGTEREVDIIRDVIELPSVKGTRIVDDGVGYVRITQFARPTADLLQKALDSLQQEDMQALVLDLRSNPGGLLFSAIEVAEKFLKKNQVIVTTKGRKGVYPEKVSKARGDKHYTGFPVAILVNGGSASASEIVAGALQDHKRAVLVGSTTFGKGSVQSVIKLRADNETAIRLTTAHYYTPSDRLIHGTGIDPDIPVLLEPGEWRNVQMARSRTESPELYSDEEKSEYADVVDKQLERAVDLLRAVKIFRSNGK
jgi:carboxyl-terminal processing protease